VANIFPCTSYSRVTTRPLSEGYTIRESPRLSWIHRIPNRAISDCRQRRLEAEFRSLYAAAGFALSRTVPTDMAFASIVEGMPE
jgi:hypothetical protein